MSFFCNLTHHVGSGVSLPVLVVWRSVGVSAPPVASELLIDARRTARGEHNEVRKSVCVFECHTTVNVTPPCSNISYAPKHSQTHTFTFKHVHGHSRCAQPIPGAQRRHTRGTTHCYLYTELMCITQYTLMTTDYTTIHDTL